MKDKREVKEKREMKRMINKRWKMKLLGEEEQEGGVREGENRNKVGLKIYISKINYRT